MAQGSVATPVVTVTPTQATYAKRGQLPAIGSGMNLSAGVNRFGFSGQWGVDFDVVSVSSSAQTAHLANWAHNSAPGTETTQFQQATGRPFEERQDILRIQGSGPFQTLLLPYRHGQRPSDLRVRQSGSSIIITNNGGTTTVGSSSYSYQDSHIKILTAFNSTSASGLSMGITGGPAEISMTSSRAAITISGSSGQRTFTLPGRWHLDPTAPNSGLSFQSGHWVMNYHGGSPVTLRLLVG
jgi:hypothetical protein